VEVARQLIEIDPNFPVGYLQLTFNSQFAGRLDDAEKAIRAASDRKLQDTGLLLQRFDIAFLKGDQAGMDREVAAAAQAPGAEDAVADRQAFVFAYSGQLAQAKKMAKRAADLNQEPVKHGTEALYELGPALWDAFFGNAASARNKALAALELSKDRDVEYGAAFALALSGESTRSRLLATDLEKQFPEDSGVKLFYLPAIRALLNLKSDPLKALELLEVSRPFDRGTPPSGSTGFFGNFYTVYVRGLAYLAAHRGPEAATEFQEVIDGRNIVVSDPIGALAHLQLARAWVLSGDKAKAKAAYQDFLALWKAADQGIPILAEATRESAALN